MSLAAGSSLLLAGNGKTIFGNGALLRLHDTRTVNSVTLNNMRLLTGADATLKLENAAFSSTASIGGLGTVIGSGANDRIPVCASTLKLIDGGAGTDTLALAGADFTYDLRGRADQLHGIEVIDLTGTGKNTVIVTAQAVLAANPATRTLRINGNAGDLWQGKRVIHSDSAPSTYSGSLGVEGFVLVGQTEQDQAGWSVSAAGDTNGDGLSDVVSGAPGTTNMAVVAYGKAAPGVILGTTGQDTKTGTTGADRLVGAPDADGAAKARPGAGTAYVVLGTAAGLAGDIDLANIAAGTGGFAIHGESTADFAGRTLAGAGDVNGDGLADLLVGAPDARGGTGDSTTTWRLGEATVEIDTAIKHVARSTLSIAATATKLAEGASGATPYAFTVTRTGSTEASAAADWQVTGGGVTGTGAANGTDFTGGLLPAGRVSLAPGQASATITVPVAGDIMAESNESFTVTLSGLQAGLALATASATGAILADDFASTAANQTLTGTDTADVFLLGGGLDTIIAKAGLDSFRFLPAALGTAATNATTLTDFSRATGEVLDLSALDANPAPRPRRLHLRRHRPVQRRPRRTPLAGHRRHQAIQGNVTAGITADLTITVKAAGPVDAAWFVL